MPANYNADLLSVHLRRAIVWLCLTAAAVFMLPACTSAVPYHLAEPVESLAKGTRQEVKLGYVEVDDMGELQDFKQLTAVTSALKTESHKAPLRVILFVHGWNNDARNGSNSLEHFKTVLTGLQEAQSQNGGGRIFGVFIGWRGQTFKHFKPSLDFYHRYQGGHRVGTGAGTDAIYEVAATAKKANEKNVVILCGHSFGGLLLEDAISQPIRARLAEIHAKGEGTMHSHDILPADMIILLNEAQHAVKARQLVSALRDRRVSTGGKDLPWIVSITSLTDDATGKAFPLGVTLGRTVPPFNLFNTSVSGSYRKGEIAPHAGSQKEAAHRTAGHFQPLHSHEVVRMGDCPKLKENPDQYHHIQENLNPIKNGHIRYQCSAGEYAIQRIPAASEPFNTTPYWIMDVSKEVIADHGDIWSPRVTGLVTALIHLRTQQSVKAAPSAPARPQTAPQTRPLQLQLQSL